MYFLKNFSNINNLPTSPKILIAPLDWGLGHATRCIPIINELIAQHCEIFIAAEGGTLALLKKEFPDVTFLPLIGYKVKYSRNRILLPLKILIQVPRMMYTIFKEHGWLKNTIKQYKINAVISDNRFGMYSPHIYSVYITHQLLIKTNSIFTDKIVQQINYIFINKYDECWVPDFEINGLAGELSHPKKLPVTVKYLGCVSRFEKKEKIKKYDLLISISGPEPQRTIFEDTLLNDLKSFKGKVLFVRGLPETNETIKSDNLSMEFKNHLAGAELNDAMLEAEMILSRCGYTTVMDLIKLGKKAILIPTPGQTEQEYLASYLMQNKIFYSVAQKQFFLQDAIERSAAFAFNTPEYNMEEYKIAIDKFLAVVKANNTVKLYR